MSLQRLKRHGILLLMSCCFLGATQASYGQERVQASKAYHPGDSIMTPLYGIKLVVPAHWNGFLTRGTEIFTLECDTSGASSIKMFPSEESLKDIENRWRGKIEFAPGIELVPDHEPGIVDGAINTAFSITGDDVQTGFAYATCGDFGFCYTAFLLVDRSQASYYQDVLSELSESITFFKPTITDYYGDYDWSQELKGKYMVTFERGQGSNKQNHLWLCEDGSFTANITRRGGLKGTTGPYNGKLKGTYSIEGVGSSGRIQLNFDDLTPLQLPLEIKDDVIYMNGLRYSISLEHNRCK